MTAEESGEYEYHHFVMGGLGAEHPGLSSRAVLKFSFSQAGQLLRCYFRYPAAFSGGKGRRRYMGLSEKANVIGAVVALAIYVNVILVFVARLMKKRILEHWLGLVLMVAAVPLVYLLVVAPSPGCETLASILHLPNGCLLYPHLVFFR
jgi:hypothetical protein